MATTMKKSLALVSFISIFVFGGFNIAMSQKNNISDSDMQNHEIVEIANRVAQSLGYEVDEMDAVSGDENEDWKKKIGVIPSWEKSQDTMSQLSGKKYWAVYFKPRAMQFGGDLWIFLSKESKEPILTIRGQ